jgi:hypothetical protein
LVVVAISMGNIVTAETHITWSYNEGKII